jgi:hypothetical protein
MSKSNANKKAKAVKSHVSEAVEVDTAEQGPQTPVEGKAHKKAAEQVVLTQDQKDNLEATKTVSGKIRYLASFIADRGEIARILGKRYQHVRNVLETPLKRATSAPVKAGDTEKAA